VARVSSRVAGRAFSNILGVRQVIDRPRCVPRPLSIIPGLAHNRAWYGKPAADATLTQGNEQQEKSRQLAEASQHKSQFLASMSHELRTPLNAVIGLTEMMLTHAAKFGTEKAEEPLRRVNAAGTHLLGLINEVLDLSKIEAGKLELNPESVSLATLIDEVIGTAGQLAEKNKNRLVARIVTAIADGTGPADLTVTALAKALPFS
jgi:signal transduction histidine kinase